MIAWSLAFFILVSYQYFPYNILLVATALTFVKTHGDNSKLDLPQKWFVAWILWAFVCSLASRHSIPSILGTLVRGEGLLFWIVLARMAYLYWEKNESEAILCILIFIFFVADLSVHVFYPEYNPGLPFNLPKPTVRSGFYSVSIPILWASVRSLSIFGVVGLALSGVMMGAPHTEMFASHLRSSWIGAFSGIFSYKPQIFKSKGIAIVLAILLSICAFNHSLREKFSKIDLWQIGSGTRVEWIIQTWDLSKKSPLFGYGLDSQGWILKNPVGKSWTAAEWPDRTHNVFCDILLQTGYVGLILFVCSLSSAFYIAYTQGNGIHRMCTAGILAWLVAGIFNPQGPAAHILFLVLLFGVNRKLCPQSTTITSKDSSRPIPIS